uniref:Uncharacterized protein n=1 Tax=Rhodosorus marinus TaxID=101924 RepID=A0A7S0BJH8_9RHOD|mmetsp:Transcript_17115/g.24538  ORF Transcript_17115/g.24538 Transcript_17115/m.24538 type:complete len:383 (+) Transcript_17115:75-1223(+)
MEAALKEDPEKAIRLLAGHVRRKAPEKSIVSLLGKVVRSIELNFASVDGLIECRVLQALDLCMKKYARSQKLCYALVEVWYWLAQKDAVTASLLGEHGVADFAIDILRWSAGSSASLASLCLDLLVKLCSLADGGDAVSSDESAIETIFNQVDAFIDTHPKVVSGALALLAVIARSTSIDSFSTLAFELIDYLLKTNLDSKGLSAVFALLATLIHCSGSSTMELVIDNVAERLADSLESCTMTTALATQSLWALQTLDSCELVPRPWDRWTKLRSRFQVRGALPSLRDYLDQRLLVSENAYEEDSVGVETSEKPAENKTSDELIVLSQCSSEEVDEERKNQEVGEDLSLRRKRKLDTESKPIAPQSYNTRARTAPRSSPRRS